MNATLLVLNLEDDQLGAELIENALVSEGVPCEVLRVETRSEFLTALEHQNFDLILADYSLPGFDGLSALELACEHCPDTPFIFVTGTMGEEIAVESLKHGATDYVLKQNLARLVLWCNAHYKKPKITRSANVWQKPCAKQTNGFRR